MSAPDDDSRPVVLAELEADRLHLEQVAALTRQWAQCLRDAQAAVRKAVRLRGQLFEADFEFSEPSAEGVAKRNLDDAARSIGSVMTIADGLLRPIEDAEKDAEIVRLRAEVGQLQRRLGDRDAILADDAARYHGWVTALDGFPRFCALPPGHQAGCRTARGNVIITAADPANAVDPIEGADVD